jgi:drug/metabolite transporter (DMT)-like permease
MFVGEALSLIFYAMKNLSIMKSLGFSHPNEVNIPFYWAAMPALFDSFGSGLMNFSIGLITASVYQMLRGSSIIFTAIASCLFFNKRLERHQTLGIVLIIIGIITIGISTQLDVKGNTMKESSLLGVILMIVSQTFYCGYILSEQYIFSKYNAYM